MRSNRPATLEDILAGRDNRARLQKELLKKHSLPLVSFTVVMPGPVKLCDSADIIFRAGCEAIEAAIPPEKIKEKKQSESIAGIEVIYAVDMQDTELKRLCCEIEDENLLGRLFDIDVIGTDGIPKSRTEIGFSPRKCLICGAPAAECVRSRKHSVEELLCEIEKVINKL